MPAKSSSSCPCGCGHRPRSGGNRMRPLVCDQCAFPLRVAHVWMARLESCPPCPIEGCTGRLIPPCLEDLLAMDEDMARNHPAYGKCCGLYSLAAVVAGARRGHYSDPIRCAKCPSFIRHKGALCDCGWQNDVHGNGFYTSAGCANDNVAIPF